MGVLLKSCFAKLIKVSSVASIAMGASLWTIIRKVLIPESLPALVSGITVTTISLVGYTAMAGVIGAGGWKSSLLRWIPTSSI